MEALISALLTTFGQYGLDKLRYNYSLVTGLDKELDEIPEMLKKASDKIDDAEYTGFKKPEVKRWLKKLEKVAYELEVILDEWNYKSLLKQNKEAAAAPQNAEAAAAPQNASQNAEAAAAPQNAEPAAAPQNAPQNAEAAAAPQNAEPAAAPQNAPQNAEAAAAPQNTEASAASVMSFYSTYAKSAASSLYTTGVSTIVESTESLRNIGESAASLYTTGVSTIVESTESLRNIGESAASFYNSVSNSDEYTSSSLSIADKIKNVKSTLVKLLEERKELTLESRFQPRPDRMTKSDIDEDNVFGSGIKDMKKIIVSKLTPGGDGIQILSIVGDGGIGKTKLAQLVFSDPEFADWSKIWVCVSTPFVVNVVAKNIFNILRPKAMLAHNDQPEFAIKSLKAAISGKKYLLVLDDVWTEDEDEWEALMVALKKGKPGSKILVTTRSEKVVDAMGTLEDAIFRPKHLTDGECWEILRHKSFLARKKDEYEEFEEVGMKIASKCKGLPLVAVVLGKLLKYKDLDTWKEVEKSEIWKLEDAEVKLFPVWVLSYNDLSADLKRCFSYCAVYPKDHKIHAQTLIEEWMALGYLGTDSGNGELEPKGREYLKSLAMRSLFQDIEKSEPRGPIEWCKMHDIVHDFALFLRKNDYTEKKCQACGQSWVSLVQEYRSLSWVCKALHEEKNEGKGRTHICNCLKSVRVLRMNSVPPPPKMNMLIHLRRLQLDTCRNVSNDVFKIICGLYFLQTLKLTNCPLSGIPQEIGNLVKLRHLDLSRNRGIQELPATMNKLVELRSLDLCWNEGLKELPQSIGSLVELRILKIEGTGIECLPEEIGELSNLCTLELPVFKVGSRYSKFRFLKNLNSLRFTGTLNLEIHCSRESELQELAKDAKQAPFHKLFSKLETLDINFRATTNETNQSSSEWTKVVQALLPKHKLEKLSFSGYKGSGLLDWMLSPCNNIKSIKLTIFSEVSSLPAMGKLPFLEDLYIALWTQLKLVGPEFLGIEPSCVEGVAFPQLKKLKFDLCQKWEEWEDITEEQEVSAAISIMPCLTDLTIFKCESLKKLPHRLLGKAASKELRVLNIYGSKELVKTYLEDNEGSAWTSISEKFPKLVLLQEQWPV